MVDDIQKLLKIIKGVAVMITGSCDATDRIVEGFTRNCICFYNLTVDSPTSYYLIVCIQHIQAYY